MQGGRSKRSKKDTLISERKEGEGGRGWKEEGNGKDGCIVYI